ncbi:MAG: hypothetical protein LW808_001940 [Verrucomicrobiota bacterium]|nr:MAG: hypothetical protein LW808_001940 [Verrucomicrobiota bacterium]
MNTKINKLALCALLSAGGLSAVNGDDKVSDLLGKDSVQLFNRLQTPERCETALKKAGKLLAKVKKQETRNALTRLIEKLNFLCNFWSWFCSVEPDELDVEAIFSEDVSGDKDLKSAEELIFLRDAGWGRQEVREANEDNGDCKDKFEKLQEKCKKFI